MSLVLFRSVYIIFIICCLSQLAKTQADLSCTKMLDTRTQDYCCGNTILSKFMFMTSNCSKYWNTVDSCRYECLFNHWNLLDSEHRIKRPELYTMITKLYNPLNGYNSYGTAMKRAYEICDKLYTKYADFILLYSSQTQYNLRLDQSCQPFALYYAQCVAGNMFMNCPIEYLANNKKCNEHKTALISCTKHLGLTETLDEAEYPREPESRKNCCGKKESLIQFFILVNIFRWIDFIIIKYGRM